jgi:hypothetical protein
MSLTAKLREHLLCDRHYCKHRASPQLSLTINLGGVTLMSNFRMKKCQEHFATMCLEGGIYLIWGVAHKLPQKRPGHSRDGDAKGIELRRVERG